MNMRIVHLTASTFFGGPERQMLGLAEALRPGFETTFVSFAEGGRCEALLSACQRAGFRAEALGNDTPRLRAAARELTALLRDQEADIVCSHGYKADLLGWWSARRCGIPIVAVSRGWTWENRKVRTYEAIDRYLLRWVDQVVCVSEGQAAKVRQAGVPEQNVSVIRNAIRAERFGTRRPAAREVLQGLFPSPRRLIVGAAGRLSPEKGFDVLIRAAATIAEADRSIGFVLFGDGPLRDELARRIADAGLADAIVLAGHRKDLDDLLPHLDLSVLPSYTEGLPNVVLEAMAAGLPVVATAVGGTPEVVVEGETGYLIPPGDASALAARIKELLACESTRRTLGERGRLRVQECFAFETQARDYRSLFAQLENRGTQPRQSLRELLQRAFRRSRVAMPLAAVTREEA
jgi:glycosyltransferase involved in cell wall biosynthesis